MHKYIFCGLALFLAACTPKSSISEMAEIVISGDTIIVRENSPILQELEFDVVKTTAYSSKFQTVGEVVPITGRIAHISVPFAGRVARNNVRLGQSVGVGTPIFELNSLDFYEATKGYFAAKTNSEIAQKRYERQRDLVQNGVGSLRDLEQMQSEAYIAERELEQAESALKMFNVNPSSISVGQPLKVTSPIAGEVLKCNATIGDFVGEDGEPLAIVADLSKVWVRAYIKEQYFGAVSKGDSVEIGVASMEKSLRGVIHYVGEIVDTQSRSLEVLIECDNVDRSLKLGMFCNATFLSVPAHSVILPATAIMQERESDYVYVKLSDNRFVRRKVISTTADEGFVLISEGIAVGETVMTRGGIFLNM